MKYEYLNELKLQYKSNYEDLNYSIKAVTCVGKWEIFKIKIKIYIAQIYMWIWSNALYTKYYAYIIIYLA